MILHQYTKNYDHMMYSCRAKDWDRKMNGRADRWKKWIIEEGTPPKKNFQQNKAEIWFEPKDQ